MLVKATDTAIELHHRVFSSESSLQNARADYILARFDRTGKLYNYDGARATVNAVLITAKTLLNHTQKIATIGHEYQKVARIWNEVVADLYADLQKARLADVYAIAKDH